MAYLLKFLDIFRWKKHYGREWGIQKIFMDFIKERMNRIMSKVYIFFVDGFEDIEGLTVVDLMRRAGIDIQTVSIKEKKRSEPLMGSIFLQTVPLENVIFLMRICL